MNKSLLLGTALLIAIAGVTFQNRGLVVENVGLLDQYVRNDFSIPYELPPKHEPIAFMPSEDVLSEDTLPTRSLDQDSKPIPTGHVLAATATAPVQDNVQAQSTEPSVSDDHIRDVIASFLSQASIQALFRGAAGPQGEPGPPGPMAPYQPVYNPPPSVPGPIPSVFVPGGIVQPNPTTNFSGVTLFSATDLSSQRFNTGTATVTDMLTAQNINVTGTITGNVTGSINPGFTAGSVLFQGTNGLAQDNSNFFWDDTNNRLGIGTILPGSKLEIKGTGTSSATSSLNVTDSSGTSKFFVRDDGNVGIGITAPSAILHTVASGAKTATYAGNLLTNTATSSTASIDKYGLQIQSTGTWNGASAKNIGLYISSVTGGTNNYDAIFNGGGNVGIGTTSPNANLEVSSTSGNSTLRISTTSTGNTPRLLFDRRASGTPADSGMWDFLDGNISLTGRVVNDADTAATNWLQVTRSGTTITNVAFPNGNVGVGTTGPNFKLEVVRPTGGVVARFTDSDGSCDIDPTSTALICSSDARLKTNVTTVGSALDKILQFRGVNFRWNNQTDNSLRYGFIAQEVEPIAPELVKTDPASGYKSVNYTGFTPILVNAVQELSAKVDSLRDFSWVKDEFKKVGVVIEQEVIKIKSLSVEKLQIGSADKPSGFVMYDEDTKEAYCVKIKSGEFVKLKGECDTQTTSLPPTPAQTPTEQVAPTTDPEVSQTQETIPQTPAPSEPQAGADQAQ